MAGEWDNVCAMKTLGIVANITKPRLIECLSRIVVACHKHKINVISDDKTSRFCKGKIKSTKDVHKQADVIMALGGDGTMLRAVRELSGRNKPLIGVNLGGLGFFTSVSADDIELAVESLAKKKYSTSFRTLIECSVIKKGKKTAVYHALNDVVISNSISRVVTLDVSIDDDIGSSSLCDGLIVATPSGSTGHSLSNGGPIITPETRAFVVNFICPHTLSSRPLVVPDSSHIDVHLADCDRNVLLTVDGQVSKMINNGDRLILKKSQRKAQFIHLSDYRYFSVLRKKLHWSGSALREASS